jgi:hypothetical protein
MYVKARAVADSHEWGLADTGTEQVGVLLELLEGEHSGQRVTWYGYFTEASEDRTLESLRIAGWNGNDLLNLPGLGSTEFQLTMTEEENQNTGQVFWKASFINRIGVAMRNVMDERQKAAFAARMRAKTGSGVGGQRAQRSAPSRPPDTMQRRATAQTRTPDTAIDDIPPPDDDDIPW